ncbi:hypothetical protein ES705_16435 [subsurface metagenome]
MNKTKIDYVDFTWNPVWGCRGTCSYCYARKIAQRFGKPIRASLEREKLSASYAEKTEQDICQQHERYCFLAS